jgi:ATP-binding cassette, subfamily F, member 3
MSLIQVRNLDKFYGAVPIIREAELIIQPGEKWGLVGKNGCGKTTLIKVLTGEEDYDRGEIHWAQNCRIGYLRQEPDFRSGFSIYQELRQIFGALDQLQERLAGLQQRMLDQNLAPDELGVLIEEQHHLSEEFEQAGGYQIEGRIQGVLRGLGFPKERWEDAAANLSGGEQTRLALAKLLLTPWDILLLDEPTNYLDLTAIEWLEDFLLDFKGAVLLISHDRFFLDKIVTGIYEIEFNRVNRYKGNYTAYRGQKEAVYQATLKAYQEQEKYLLRQEKLVRESRATEKSKKKAHSIEKRLAGMERIAKPLQDHKQVKLAFKESHSSSRQVLTLENLSKSFGPKPLLNGVTYKLEAGEKVGLIGPNGSGKTTLLKMILGLEQPDRGNIRLGYEVQPGYFTQLNDQSDMTGTPFSQIMDTGDLDNTEVRGILARFLFTGEDVFKSVADLSGGERRRLGLLKLMLSKANFLILDEPTNHLDLTSIEAVENALLGFEGTVFIVSHDRYFLNQIVDRYLAIIDQKLVAFSTYQDYLNYRSQMANQSNETSKPKNESQFRREQNKETQREMRKKQRNLNEIETDISDMETRKSELLNELNDPAVHTDYKKSLELTQELAGIESKLTQSYERWEQLQQELNEMATS